MATYSVNGTSGRGHVTARKQLKREVWIVESRGGRIEMVMEYWLLLDKFEDSDPEGEFFDRPLSAISPVSSHSDF